MKEALDDQSRVALIQYRIDRAYETMKEAALLAGEGYYNAALNRLYYACFYFDGIACSSWHFSFDSCRCEDNAWTSFRFQRHIGQGTWQDFQPAF